MTMFDKVLVANRGEIAVRIMRTCQDLGIRTVAVYSDLDHRSLHVRLADEAYAIGGQTASESYLNTEAILDVARRCGADALHPGYGFFSERADFARAVADQGWCSSAPRLRPSKPWARRWRPGARRLAAGVSRRTGHGRAAQSADEVIAFGEENGWPVAIKAAYGGGGRGMRVVSDAGVGPAAFEACQREALGLLRPFRGLPGALPDRPRHVEIQLMADSHGNVVWLGERDCSVQRRHQKLIEETPRRG